MTVWKDGRSVFGVCMKKRAGSYSRVMQVERRDKIMQAERRDLPSQLGRTAVS